MPAVFFGHGNPMNALLENEYTRGWARIGNSIPRPKAVLSISAHWYLPATLVTANERQRTIHDFGGFPQKLYEFQYPAQGAPELAERVCDLLAPVQVGLDYRWGLDHGTWAVLCHVFPDANVPVIQLSIDESKPAEYHYEIGRRLAPLRDEGVLIAGSGNIVHNLHAYAWGKEEVSPYEWGLNFENLVRECVLSGNHEPLINYESLGRDAMLSAPTPDHYLPLLYILGMQKEGEPIDFPVEGFDGGSVSMLSIRIG